MTDSSTRWPQALSWPFPARTTHDGIPLGNGLFGALIWGAEQSLRITINRQDYWDHRGGIDFGPDTTYPNLRHWLENNDEASLREAFEGPAPKPGQPRRPTHLPMGRLDLWLGDCTITAGQLCLASGEALIKASAERPISIRAIMPRNHAVLAIHIDKIPGTEIVATSVPANSAEVLEHWQAHRLPIPRPTDQHDAGGWVQTLPNDPALAVYWERAEHAESIEFYIAAERGDDAEQARTAAEKSVRQARDKGYAALADAEANWWRAYWRETARVTVPDETLQELYDLALYRLPCMSMPGTPPAGLQGPWIEEYRMPPWQSDYHFNINVQECYWPAYGGNYLRALEPLWDMLQTWMPKLRDNARKVYGIDDGLMLPHSVDDRGTCTGGFWTGTIDHGSTGWMGQMMWQYYLYTQDKDFLKRLGYPFMRDAMRVYEVMLEKHDNAYHLPISVSPEYGGSAMWAWGANASFQLAIIHCLCRALIQSALILELDVDTTKWREIDANLPAGSIQIGDQGPEFGLWDGQPLAMSHRHHSHLASLYPFDTVNPWDNDQDRELIENSFRTWVRTGTGNWSGWCLPWAAILWARMHNGERAALLLEEMARVFRTAGKATTHDAVIKGFTTIANRPDIMQMDATMGAANAVLEMLLHTANGITRVFPATPANWQQVRFDGILIPGAFLVSAEQINGHTSWVQVTAEHKGTCLLENPFAPHTATIRTEGSARDVAGTEHRLQLEMKAGQTCILVLRNSDIEGA